MYLALSGDIDQNLYFLESQHQAMIYLMKVFGFNFRREVS